MLKLANAKLRSCVKVEVDVLDSLSLISDHQYNNSPYGLYGCKATLKRMLKLEKLLIRAAPNPTSDV